MATFATTTAFVLASLFGFLGSFLSLGLFSFKCATSHYRLLLRLDRLCLRAIRSASGMFFTLCALIEA
jgi:hypothetical protein